MYDITVNLSIFINFYLLFFKHLHISKIRVVLFKADFFKFVPCFPFFYQKINKKVKMPDSFDEKILQDVRAIATIAKIISLTSKSSLLYKRYYTAYRNWYISKKVKKSFEDIDVFYYQSLLLYKLIHHYELNIPFSDQP